MEALTGRQRRVLDAILRFCAREERPPTTRELASMLSCHVKTVWQHLAVLERKGCLERRKGRIRLARELARGGGVPIIGRVAAGTPILAVENREGALSLDDLFGAGAGSGTGEAGLFAVRVTGESMTGAGILDGDFVVVRSVPRVESGEIAVCALGEEGDITVKRLVERAGGIELVPANAAFAPIRVAKDDAHFRVVGKVVGVVRRVR